jgi:hypothetical protein
MPTPMPMPMLKKITEIFKREPAMKMVPLEDILRFVETMPVKDIEHTTMENIRWAIGLKIREHFKDK